MILPFRLGRSLSTLTIDDRRLYELDKCKQQPYRSIDCRTCNGSRLGSKSSSSWKYTVYLGTSCDNGPRVSWKLWLRETEDETWVSTFLNFTAFVMVSESSATVDRLFVWSNAKLPHAPYHMAHRDLYYSTRSYFEWDEYWHFTPSKGPITDYGSTMVNWMRHRGPRHRGRPMMEMERPSPSYIIDVCENLSLFAYLIAITSQRCCVD